MKKIVGIISVFGAILCIASCDYDDSNDIDIIKPNDSTETGVGLAE